MDILDYVEKHLKIFPFVKLIENKIEFLYKAFLKHTKIIIIFVFWRIEAIHFIIT